MPNDITLNASARLMFDQLPVAVLWFEGTGFVHGNREWTTLSELALDECAGDGWLAAIHPGDHDLVSACLRSAPGDAEREVDVRIVGGGDACWAKAHCRAPDGGVRVMTITVVGPHRSNEDRLLHLSSHDGLTGLPNRASLVRQVRRHLESTDAVTALLFIDLDHFKQVNDHLGHRYGDELLKTAARRVQLAIRSTDHVGRLGGDEIGVFCPDVESPDDVHALASRVGQALATPFQVHDQMVIIDASIGVAFSGDSVRTAEQLIDQADRAMYLAKAAGGGRWAVVDKLPTAARSAVVDPDPTLREVRADIDRAEERATEAWQQSTLARDLEKASRLEAIREALRRVSLLLRIDSRIDVVVPSPVDVSPKARAAGLQAALDESVLVAQAIGMIAQRTGVDAPVADGLLAAFAADSELSLARAAAKVVDRSVDIDSIVGIDPMVTTARPEALDAAAFHEMYEAHSAAVYALARYICGTEANRVTEETFWIAWRQHDHGVFIGRTARVALLTIAHRRAMKTALRTARRSDDSSRSMTIAEVLRRGQAFERTMACAPLTPGERSVTALVVYGRCTSSEVAKILDEDEHNVNHRLRAALGRLRIAEPADQ